MLTNESYCKVLPKHLSSIALLLKM